MENKILNIKSFKSMQWRSKINASLLGAKKIIKI